MRAPLSLFQTTTTIFLLCCCCCCCAGSTSSSSSSAFIHHCTSIRGGGFLQHPALFPISSLSNKEKRTTRTMSSPTTTVVEAKTVAVSGEEGDGSTGIGSISQKKASSGIIDSSSSSSGGIISQAARKRLVYGDNDVLFGAIERQQGDRPFGALLDAGTGLHSLRWIATLSGGKGMTGYTAVTADETMRSNVYNEAVALGIENGGRVIIGNWFDQANPLTLYEKYDTIIADYLIGAMDGFSPYRQDLMIPKLVSYLKPGGRIYVVGLQPLPDKVAIDDAITENQQKGADLICKVRRVRDSCILLAGHRCYREYPVDWIQRQFANLPDATLLQTSSFPILYRYSTIVKQINVARSKLKHFPSETLALEMGQVLDDLDTQLFKLTETVPRIKLGFDYVVSAEKKKVAQTQKEEEENKQQTTSDDDDIMEESS